MMIAMMIDRPRILSGIALQKLKSPLIKLVDLFVDRSVSTAVEDEELGVRDVVFQRRRKTSRRDHIELAKRDLSRRLDFAELRFNVVIQHRIGLPDKSVGRLCRPAAHKRREGLDVIRTVGVKIRRETPRKDPRDNQFGDTSSCL